MSAGRPDPAPARPDDIEDADPGLASERTHLAWTRSSISFAALGAAILRFRPAVGVPILIFSAVVWSLGHFSRTPDQARAAPRRVLLVTVAVTVLALTALVITLLGPGSRGIRL